MGASAALLAALAVLMAAALHTGAHAHWFGQNASTPAVPAVPEGIAAGIVPGMVPTSSPNSSANATLGADPASKLNATLGLLTHGANVSDFLPFKLIHRTFNSYETDGDEPGGGPDRYAKPIAQYSVSGINYYGGPIMNQAVVNIYYIWYGNWAGNSGVSLLTNLAKNMGASSWYRIMSTYYDTAGKHVPTGGSPPALRYVTATTDAYSQGTSLSDNAVQAIVVRAINTGALGKVDPNGLYFVLTTQDVTATSGFCTQYCAWHTYAMIQGVAVNFAFVGNGARCPSSCAPFSPSPNSNVGADGMASTLSHELTEMVTDPTFTAWYDSQGYECADKCAWTYGTTWKIFTGAMYNVIIGPNAFMIQRNWLNTGAGSCVSTY